MKSRADAMAETTVDLILWAIGLWMFVLLVTTSADWVESFGPHASHPIPATSRSAPEDILMSRPSTGFVDAHDLWHERSPDVVGRPGVDDAFPMTMRGWRYLADIKANPGRRWSYQLRDIEDPDRRTTPARK